MGTALHRECERHRRERNCLAGKCFMCWGFDSPAGLQSLSRMITNKKFRLRLPTVDSNLYIITEHSVHSTEFEKYLNSRLSSR